MDGAQTRISVFTRLGLLGRCSLHYISLQEGNHKHIAAAVLPGYRRFGVTYGCDLSLCAFRLIALASEDMAPYASGGCLNYHEPPLFLQTALSWVKGASGQLGSGGW